MNEITRHDAGSTALTVRTDVDQDAALDLLSYVARWDNRKPSAAMAEAWAISAQLAGWTQAEAEQAIRHLQTFTRDYLTPGAVTAWIESQRRRARLSEEGTNPDGTARITFTGALSAWREAFRNAGPSPSAEQEAKATELLEQMLDGAGDPLAVVVAAVLAGSKLTARVDVVAERIAAGKENETHMPPVPVRYLRPDQRNPLYGHPITFEYLRDGAYAATAARFIRKPYADPSPHPDEQTPRLQWIRAQRVAFLDAHEREIRVALGQEAG